MNLKEAREYLANQLEKPRDIAEFRHMKPDTCPVDGKAWNHARHYTGAYQMYLVVVVVETHTGFYLTYLHAPRLDDTEKLLRVLRERNARVLQERRNGVTEPQKQIQTVQVEMSL